VTLLLPDVAAVECSLAWETVMLTMVPLSVLPPSISAARTMLPLPLPLR
jgi:hypothetical protein